MREKLKRFLTPRFDIRNYSRLGLASFIMAMIIGLLVIIDITLVIRFQNDPMLVSEFRVMDSWLTWAIVLVAVAGIVLGLAATAQAQKKRIFGVVGLIVNSLFLLGIFLLYLSNTIAFWRSAAGG